MQDGLGQEAMSDPFRIKRGLVQGDSLSPFVWLVVLAWVLANGEPSGEPSGEHSGEPRDERRHTRADPALTTNGGGKRRIEKREASS